MASQYFDGLGVLVNGKAIQRNNSYQSSHTSGHESNASSNDTNSRSEGSSGKTPSEYSLPTPDDDRPDIDQFYFGMDANMPVFTMENTKIKRLSDDSTAGHQSLNYIRPEMLASLTAQYDYKLNRYSSVSAISDLPHFEEESEDEVSEGGEEFDVDFEESDLYTPIEIARPVSLVMQKPAVVSISSPRSPSFPPRTSMDSRISGPHSRTSSVDKALPPAPLDEVDTDADEEVEEEEEEPVSPMETSSSVFERAEIAPAPIPPRRASSRMNSLKSLIRHTSSQLRDIKEEKLNVAPQFSRRNSVASSIHSRSGESQRNFDLGAFIASPPVPRIVTSPSVVIPTRSTSKRHSKDFTTSPTAPPLTPRNPRRNMRQHTTAEYSGSIRNSISEETYLPASGAWV